MKLTITAWCNLEGRELHEDDYADIKEDLEESLRYYGGKGITVEAKVE